MITGISPVKFIKFSKLPPPRDLNAKDDRNDFELHNALVKVPTTGRRNPAPGPGSSAALALMSASAAAGPARPRPAVRFLR